MKVRSRPRHCSCFPPFRLMLKQSTRPSGVACTTTRRSFKFRVSAERLCPITRADCLRDLRGGRCIATRAGWGELNQRALAATVDGKRRSAGQRERIDVAVDAPRLLGIAEPE